MGKHIKEEEAKRIILEFLERRGSMGATIREMEHSLPMNYEKLMRTLNELREKVISERPKGALYFQGTRYFLKSL